MCLYAVKEFKKPVKEKTGWKVLSYDDDGDFYYTPHRYVEIRKGQKYLVAKGKRNKEHYYGDTIMYSGGYIHCYTTRERARERCGDKDKVIKVKCHNVRALGDNTDLVCDKIEFLWNQKT